MRLDRILGLLVLCAVALGCQPRSKLSGEPPLTDTDNSLAPDAAPKPSSNEAEGSQSKLSDVQAAALYMPTGDRVLGLGQELPVTLRNLKLAELLIAPVALQDIHRARNILGTHPPNRDPLYSLDSELRLDFSSVPVAASDPSATEETHRIDVFSHVKGDVALVIARAPGTFSRVALVQRGSLNVLMKLSRERGLVWVTDGRSGEPAADALVEVRLGEHRTFRGMSNRDGIVYLPASDELRALPKDAKDKRSSYHSDLIAFASKSDLTGFTSEYFQTGLSPWEFGIAASYYSGTERLVGSVNTERGIYRAGDDVHILGVLRERKRDGTLAMVRKSVEVTVRDAEHSPISTFETQLTPFGTFHGQVSIPKTAPLGRYTIEVQQDGDTLHHRFKVAEYRPVRFEVTLGETKPPAPIVLSALDSDVTIPVSARFLYGAPVAGAKVQYSVSLRRDDPWSYYYDDYDYSYGYDYGAQAVPLVSNTLILSDDGKAEIRIEASALDPDLQSQAQRMRLIVEATVLDNTGESVSAHHSLPVYRNATQVDVHSEKWVVDAKRGWDVDVSTTGVDEKPTGATVQLQLMRRQWTSVVYENGHGRRTSGHYESRLVETRTVRVDGKKRVHFPLRDAGDYWVVATIEGKQGTSKASVWAWGNGAYGRFSDHPRVALHADKDAYEPGDDATLMVESPYETAWSLLTLERGGVLEARVQELHGASDPLKVSLTQKHLPNVFASVAIVPPLGWGKTNLVGSPLRLGYRELKVSPNSRRLSVEISPSVERAEPGDTVPVSVRVKDHTGKPVRAEVTIWAADDGVLQLTGYQTPDIFGPAYPDHVLGVTTSASLIRLMPSEYEDGTGGDGAGPASTGMAMRSRFLDTAFFSHGVVTDSSGTATILLELPDNLTRWRLVAAAADTSHCFGSADASLTAQKRLQIEPIPPRFLTRGDKFELAVDIQNNTGQRQLARIDLKSNELTFAQTQAEVELPAGKRETLRFPAEIGFVSEARLQARVSSSDLHDGIELTIPVHSASDTITTLVHEGLAGSRGEVTVPRTAEANSAHLVIESGPREVVALGAALDALIDYPHGCTEQTTSRLIPMAKLTSVLRGHPAFEGGRHRSKMQAAVVHLMKNQNADGGFSLWPKGDSKPFLTAYALWGLSIAKKSGLDVPKRVLSRALNYIANNNGKVEGYGTIGGNDAAPFSHFVRTTLGHKDSARGRVLWDDTASKSLFSRSLLVASQAPGTDATSRLRALFAQASPRGDGYFLRGASDSGYDWAYGSEIRATSALAIAASEHSELDMAGNLVRGLMAARSPSGDWGSTQNNLWALMALARHVERALPTKDALVRVRVGEQPAVALRSTATQPLARSTIHRLPTGRVPYEIETGAEDLASLVRLSYGVAVEHQHAMSQGLSVSRRIVDARTGKAVTSPKLGQLLRVELTVETPETRHQIALVDRLAAGLTPVDTELATAQHHHREKRGWSWVHRELHQERVSYFADYLSKGTHQVSYLARATQVGTFVLPAAHAEAMYQPDVHGKTAPGQLAVRP